MLSEWLAMQQPLGWVIGIILAIIGGIMQGVGMRGETDE
jgi:hypothetical protein